MFVISEVYVDAKESGKGTTEKRFFKYHVLDVKRELKNAYKVEFEGKYYSIPKTCIKEIKETSMPASVAVKLQEKGLADIYYNGEKVDKIMVMGKGIRFAVSLIFNICQFFNEKTISSYNDLEVQVIPKSLEYLKEKNEKLAYKLRNA